MTLPRPSDGRMALRRAARKPAPWRSHRKHRQCGFTLLEVMIAVLLVAVGLLGLAKTQALSMSNTQISTTRSLLAFQASSLVATMHGNRAFWAGGSAIGFSTSGATVTDAANVLSAVPVACDTSACTPPQLAAYDVKTWVANLVARFPGATSNVSCPAASPTACVVTINWSEKYVSLQAATAASAVPAVQSFSLQVVP